MTLGDRLDRLRQGLGARSTEIKLAVRVMAGTVAAFTIYELFNLPQGYWAVFTVIIVMQGSIGGTVSVAVDRMYGTLVGAVVGGVAAAIRPQTVEALGVALVLSVGLTSLCAAIRPNLKVAPVTSAIMLLSASGGLPPLEAAAYRVVEIALGSVIGVLATVLVFPAPSHALARQRAAEALDAAAALLDRCANALAAGGDADLREALIPDHDRLRGLLAQVEAAQKEAEQERSARLGDRGDPPAILRGLWRVRSGVVAIGRACSAVQPEPVRAHVATPGAELIRAEARRARACGSALVSGAAVARDDLSEIDARFLAAVETLRGEPLMAALSFDDAGHVLGLAYAAEGLRRDLGDLSDRLDELAGAQSRRPRRSKPITRV